MREKRPLEERFWEKVDKTGDCWIWTASSDEHGYGRLSMQINGKQTCAIAHRVSWELTYGPIPKGLRVCHDCEDRGCVRPSHLILAKHRRDYGT